MDFSLLNFISLAKQFQVADKIVVFNKLSISSTIITAYGGKTPYFQAVLPWLPDKPKQDCQKCSGTGYILSYSHVANGVCFQCFGK